MSFFLVLTFHSGIFTSIEIGTSTFSQTGTEIFLCSVFQISWECQMISLDFDQIFRQFQTFLMIIIKKGKY